MLGLTGEAARLRRLSFLTRLTLLGCVLTTAGVASAQSRRMWVMKAPNTIVEIDPTTFAEKGSVTLPAGALETPAALQVNAKGQMVFALGADDPTIDASKGMADKVWLWDGQKAASIGRGYLHVVANSGSNQKVTESLPAPYLSAAGTHLYWFTNQIAKLER